MPNIREKLIELLGGVQDYGVKRTPGLPLADLLCNEIVADHLIANGTTVFPCKVGDTIFEVDGEHGVVKHDVYEVCVVFKTTATDDNGMEWDDFYTLDDIGTAYKTRKEAEANFCSYGERSEGE